MPTYSYICNKCDNSFEIFSTISEYDDRPKCSHCNSADTYRNYHIDVGSQFASVRKADSELKTIGDLADRNRDKLSSDEKAALYTKHNDYKDYKEETPLPAGMTRMKKGTKTQWPT